MLPPLHCNLLCSFFGICGGGKQQQQQYNVLDCAFLMFHFAQGMQCVLRSAHASSSGSHVAAWRQPK